MGAKRAQKQVISCRQSRKVYKLAKEQYVCRSHGLKALWALAGTRRHAHTCKAGVDAAQQLPTLFTCCSTLGMCALCSKATVENEVWIFYWSTILE
jgi:hypothetical protein